MCLKDLTGNDIQPDTLGRVVSTHILAVFLDPRYMGNLLNGATCYLIRPAAFLSWTCGAGQAPVCRDVTACCGAGRLNDGPARGGGLAETFMRRGTRLCAWPLVGQPRNINHLVCHFELCLLLTQCI